MATGFCMKMLLFFTLLISAGCSMYEFKDPTGAQTQITYETPEQGKASTDRLRNSSSATPVPKDDSPPSIKITSHPTDLGIQVVENDSRTKITGQAIDPSGVVEVKVNGQPTSLDGDGYFAANVFLKVGENPIVVTAMDLRENIRRKTFTIQRSPRPAMVMKAEVGGKKGFGKFYALIIGNNNYTNFPKLKTARNDAKAVGKVLREQYGFETEVLLDAMRIEILNSLNTLRNRLGKNDSFLFYYAGHGIYDKTVNKAYWLPIDAQHDNDANWLIADTITSNIKRYSSKHVLIVADSCYSGTMTRSVNIQVASRAERDKFLKKMLRKPSRTLMASGGNEPVSDIGGRGHSIFAQIFLDALNKVEQEVFTAEELFYASIKESVAGRARQTPEYSIIRNSGHDGGDFLFVRGEKAF